MDAFALTPATDPDFARRRCFATLGEVSPVLTRDDDVRRQFVSYAIGRDLPSMSGLSPRQYDWITTKVRELTDDRRAALVEAACIETAPVIETEALTEACRQDLSPAESRDEVEALLDRIGEAGAEILWSLGDAANALLAAAPPGSLKRDVLAEYLRSHEDLKPLLSSAAPSVSEIDPSAVNRWMYYARVANRVPLELRVEFAHIPYGYFACAATTLETRGGVRVPPTLATLEARLVAVSDNEHVFKKPSDLRRWIASGSPATESGDPIKLPSAASQFREYCTFLKLEPSIADALLGAFFVQKRRAR